MNPFRKRIAVPDGKKLLDSINGLPLGEGVTLSVRQGAAVRARIKEMTGASEDQVPKIDGCVIDGHVVKITH